MTLFPAVVWNHQKAQVLQFDAEPADHPTDIQRVALPRSCFPKYDRLNGVPTSG